MRRSAQSGDEITYIGQFFQAFVYLWPVIFSSPEEQRILKILHNCTHLTHLKPGFNSTWTLNFQMFKLVLEKAEEPEIKLPTSVGSSIKQQSFRKTSTFALLTMPKPLTVWIPTNWKILKEMVIPHHLTWLLRNLYAGQEATVRTGHGKTDWFQIGKGVC